MAGVIKKKNQRYVPVPETKQNASSLKSFEKPLKGEKILLFY
jgi:hypothetical protein